MKNKFFFNTHFFNNRTLGNVFNSFSEKEALSIRKVTSKTGYFINFLKKFENYTYELVTLRNKVLIHFIFHRTV